MEKKHIVSRKYKRVVKSRERRREENIALKIRQSEVNAIPQTQNKKLDTKKKPKIKKKRRKNFLLFLIMLMLLGILAGLRIYFKEPDEGFFDIFSTKVEENIQNLNIAIVDNVDITDENNKNVVLTELNNYTNGVLLKIIPDYEIEYELLESVEKVSNMEYILNISNSNTLTAQVLQARLNSFKDTTSKYYYNVANIKEINIENEKVLRVILNNKDPLFIYNLQLPIAFKSEDTGIYTVNTLRNSSDKVTYISKNASDTNIPQSISVSKIDTDQEAVSAFKEQKIDMFFTNNYSIGDLIGKYEMDIRSYPSGDCVMLFGNMNSGNYAKKEVRQAIAYSIDRDKIKKDIYLNAGTYIDLPYIYSESKYKYDIYAAQNILLAKGYDLKDNYLYKNGEKLSLKLLVNKEDKTKVSIANYIKSDLENIGIEIQVEQLTQSKIEERIKSEEYDLVLANISLNESPDISYIEKYIKPGNQLAIKIQSLEEAIEIKDIKSIVQDIMLTMSNEIMCVGIHMDTTYVVMKKGMQDFENISYMNIFFNLLTK